MQVAVRALAASPHALDQRTRKQDKRKQHRENSSQNEKLEANQGDHDTGDKINAMRASIAEIERGMQNTSEGRCARRPPAGAQAEKTILRQTRSYNVHGALQPCWAPDATMKSPCGMLTKSDTQSLQRLA